MTKPRLLLADDSVTIRKVIELTFADEGIDVTAVADGDSAMAKFVELQPDIVLVDVGLPGTDGYHICEMIKADESTAHIPVLLLVGSFEPFDQDAAERSGADGFLTKPFHSIRDLVNRVHELLGTQEQKPIDIRDADIPFETTSQVSDTEDIEDLYEQSFAETVQMEDDDLMAFSHEDVSESRSSEGPGETVEDLGTLDASHHSVDQWLDDEMIETFRTEPDQPGDEEGSTEPSPQDEAIKAVSEYEDAPAAGVDIDVEGDHASDEKGEAEPVASDAAPEPDDGQPVAGPDVVSGGGIDIEPIKEFDWSPAAIVTAADEREIGAAAGFSTGFVSEEPFIQLAHTQTDQITEEYPGLGTTELPELEESGSSGATTRDGSADHGDQPVVPAEEPPAAASASDQQEQLIRETANELIEVIVKRVMDRLSDKAIREVAREAVPRIAEQLMREALEDERQRNS